MNKKEGDIVLTLSSLYEISLQIGKSFDVNENARSFLRTLMFQQNLSFAGYYTITNPTTFRKVFSIPKTSLEDKAFDEETLKSLVPNKIEILKEDDIGFTCFDRLNDFNQNELGVFFAGTKSILVLSKKNHELKVAELNKYALVFNKFCLFMESLESHHQIQYEIKIKNEQTQTIKRNNEQLETQNVKLRKYINSNNELEKFAYRTSHDLKAPLRTMTSFSKLLKSNKESNLNQEQVEYLGFIEQGGNQMDQLIDGILEYSRINAPQIKKDKINLHELLTQIELMLFDNINSIDATIIKTNLPEYIYGDETKLKQLFLNLLNNALKFYRKEVKPIITISCCTNDSVFSISDNGIGMKQENTEKIFEIFEKLNTDQLYKGSGIGLSTCKQIVLQHGGSIWVDSKLNEGSTFYFTIK